MIEEIVLRSACLVSEKDLWDKAGVLLPFLLSLLTLFVAWRQYRINKQQKDISLYDARYEKIYKLFFDTLTIQKEIFLIKYNDEKLKEQFNEFCDKLNYARFLIKVKDVEKILTLEINLNNYLTNFYGKYQMVIEYKTDLSEEEKKELIKKRLKELPNVDEYINDKEKEFLKIIVPYLQIEKEVWYKRIFSWIKDLFKKQKNAKSSLCLS